MCTTSTMKMNKRDLVKGLAAGTVVAFAAGCESVPIIVSESDLVTMSDQAWVEIRSQERELKDSRYSSRLQNVGGRIVNVSGLGPQGWQYAVFDSDDLNAFVLPGRQVGFYRAIMDLASTDDELAAVMGHEVSHVYYRHAAQRASQQALLQGGLAVTSVLLEGSQQQQTIMQVLGVGAQYGAILPFSRENELQADAHGVDLMAAAGYRPSAAIEFWEKMNARNGNRPPEFASTHPNPGRRIELLREQIQSKGYA
jgi:predicted Zn-dependent protease